jgi:hypothetical protein
MLDRELVNPGEHLQTDPKLFSVDLHRGIVTARR